MMSDEERIRLAMGPFGLITSRHALLFGKEAVICLPPVHATADSISNGTITFVDLGKGPIGITCAHVIEGYRARHANDSRTMFQIGDFDFDPLKYLIAENKELDLATIDLGEGRLEKALSREENTPGTQCYKPPHWPPKEVKAGDVVASLGGFPGLMREQPSSNELLFNAYSHSGSHVDSAGDRHFACQFDRAFWVSPTHPPEAFAFKAYGGMSGGPVFIDRGLHFEFVGVIKEFNESYDVMFVALARFIKEDGNITEA